MHLLYLIQKVANQTEGILLSFISCIMTSYRIYIKQAQMVLKKLQTTFFRFSTMFIKCPRERFFGHMALDYYSSPFFYLAFDNKSVKGEQSESGSLLYDK